MSSSNKYISEKSLRKFFAKVCKRIHIKKNVYSYLIDGLIKTSLRGVDSHGIRLFPHYINAALIGRVNIKPHFKFKKTAPSVEIMDADHAFGIAAGNVAIIKAIKLAKREGVGAVAVKNSSHFGAAAIYSLKAAENNMIGISFTHSDSLVLPFGGKKAYLGTNPICFAAPCSGEEPFCIDMATSQIAWNKLLLFKEKNKDLEKGWAADKNGKESTDPNNAVALLPIGAYKGYGLGLMVEILCSLLTGMPFGPHIHPMNPLTQKRRNLGHFFMAIDMSRFEEVSVFKKRMKQFLYELRNSPPASGFSDVKVAGDIEKNTFRERSKKGVPVSSHLLDEFIMLANKFDIKTEFK